MTLQHIFLHSTIFSNGLSLFLAQIEDTIMIYKYPHQTKSSGIVLHYILMFIIVISYFDSLFTIIRK